MIRTTFLSIFLLFASVCMAVPAHKGWHVYTQADGTVIELRLVGDEHFHYYLTRDDVPVVDDDDAFCYARVENSLLVSSGMLAHEATQRTMEEKRFVGTVKTTVRPTFARQNPIKRKMPKMKKNRFIGSQKGLIILANFSDKFFEGYTEETADSVCLAYQKLANMPGYTNEWGAIGSVHDYFLDQSHGLFDLSFDILGPVCLDKPYSYYGKNKYGSDIYAGQMIMECCEAVDSLIDFSVYDWDGDGVVEEVFVLYAGKGEASGGGPNTIWPHMWTLEEAREYDSSVPESFVLDGVAINIYACSNEIFSNGKPMGLGTVCHEFSHCLGLPDLYDTGDGANFGMGNWSILDNGTYNGPGGIGWVPAGFTSYERNYVGWMDLTELKTDTIIENMIPLNEQDAAAYVIYNDNCPSEYYVLENRNQSRWDAYLPSSGLLILHVDYDKDLWDNNYVNATGYMYGNDHTRLTIFLASNSRYKDANAYPYFEKDSLTDSSVPQATLYNPNIDGEYFMHKPITGIARDESTAQISFRFQNLSAINDSTDVVRTIAYPMDNANILYKMDGTVVGRMNDVNTSQLPAGIYLIRREDGKTEKYAIKR